MKDEIVLPRSWQQIKDQSSRWPLSLRAAEWATEWIVYWLKQWAFVDLLQIVASFSILWAAIQYVSSADERRQAQEDQRKAKHYQAWMAINSARGQSSGGRTDALEDLNRDGVSLSWVNLADAWLPGVRLPKAQLMASDFESAHLLGAELAGANLFGAVLRKANLTNANLQGATLVGADLTGALLLGADLRGAYLTGAKLDNALVTLVDLRGAYLARASLEGTSFLSSSLRSANLSETNVRAAEFTESELQDVNFKDVHNWREIKTLSNSNVDGMRDTPTEFVRWALDTMGATDTPTPAEQWVKKRQSIRIEIMMQNPKIK